MSHRSRSRAAAGAGGNKPRRIQLRRTRGWRKPEGAVVVARPTKWGNPWSVQECGSRERAVAHFRSAMEARLQAEAHGVDPSADDPLGPYPSLPIIRTALAGRDLCCWCPLNGPCHADVLLEIANGTA
jgi:hypothetical protein